MKHIEVEEETHERLASFGNLGQTFDDAVNDALDKAEEYERMQRAETD